MFINLRLVAKSKTSFVTQIIIRIVDNKNVSYFLTLTIVLLNIHTLDTHLRNKALSS